MMRVVMFGLVVAALAAPAGAQVVEGGFGAAGQLMPGGVSGGPSDAVLEPSGVAGGPTEQPPQIRETTVETVEEVVFSESGVEVRARLSELVNSPGYQDLEPIRMVGRLTGQQDGMRLVGTVTWTGVEAVFEDGRPKAAEVVMDTPGDAPAPAHETVTTEQRRRAALDDVLRSDVTTSTIVPPATSIAATGNVDHMIEVARRLLAGESQAAGDQNGVSEKELADGEAGAAGRDGKDGAGAGGDGSGWGGSGGSATPGSGPGGADGSDAGSGDWGSGGSDGAGGGWGGGDGWAGGGGSGGGFSDYTPSEPELNDSPVDYTGGGSTDAGGGASGGGGLPTGDDEDFPEVTTKVTEEGCTPKVDFQQGRVWLVRRTERYEDGQLVDDGECQVGLKSYDIQWDYAECPQNDPRLAELIAYPRARPYYVSSKGENTWVGECESRTKEPMQIRETREGCDAFEDLNSLTAKTYSRFIYTDRQGGTQVARDCEADGATWEITWEACGVSHEPDKGMSYVKKTAVYSIDGQQKVAAACNPQPGGYEHRKTYQGCEADLDYDGRTVNRRERTVVDIDNVTYEVAGCALTGPTALQRTTVGCEGQYLHYTSAGYSEQAVRYFYEVDGRRKYTGWGCTNGGTQFDHTVKRLGWEHDDANLRSWPVTKVVFTGSDGSEIAVTDANADKGGTGQPYTFVETNSWTTSDPVVYEGCTKYQPMEEGEIYTRADGTEFRKVTREYQESIGNACTVDRPDTSADWTFVGQGDLLRVSPSSVGGCGVGGNFQSSTLELQCKYRGTISALREDGAMIYEHTEIKIGNVPLGVASSPCVTGNIYGMGWPGNSWLTTNGGQTSFYASVASTRSEYTGVVDQNIWASNSPYKHMGRCPTRPSTVMLDGFLSDLGW